VLIIFILKDMFSIVTIVISIIVLININIKQYHYYNTMILHFAETVDTISLCIDFSIIM